MADGMAGEEKPVLRGPGGKFAKGTRPGPGRPPGVPELQAALRKMLATDAEAFAKKARQLMLEGDTNMWKLMLDRGDPVIKELLLGGVEDKPLRVSWKGSRPEDGGEFHVPGPTEGDIKGVED